MILLIRDMGKDTPGKSVNQPIRPPEAREIAREEMEKTRKLCAEYHSTLDQTKYFDSGAISASTGLLSKFKDIKQELLPLPVMLVVKHRLAYLNFIAALGKSPAIPVFLDTVKEQIGDLGSLLKNPRELYELVKDNEKFKALTPLDLLQIISETDIGITALGQVNGVNEGNWGDEADILLRPRGTRDVDTRIDDKDAAKNLETGLGKFEEFAHYVQAKKIEEGKQ